MINSLQKLLKKFPVFLNKEIGSNFYKDKKVFNEEMKEIYQSLFIVYLSENLERPLNIWKEQVVENKYIIHFEVKLANLKSVKIHKNDEVIYSKEFLLDNKKDYFKYSYTGNSLNKIPRDIFLLEVTTHDEYSFTKGFPENDTKLNNNFDHDESLDNIGKLLNVPRRQYIQVDDSLLFKTEPPYNNRLSEDDYHYSERLKYFTIHLHDTPLPLLELWKIYGIMGTITNRQKKLCKMDRDVMCTPESFKDYFIFARCSDYSPLIGNTVVFYFKVVNSLGQDIPHDEIEVLLDGEVITTVNGNKYSFRPEESMVNVPLSFCFRVGEINSNEFVITPRDRNTGDWYVSVSGNDSNDGKSPINAFKTLLKATSVVGNGEVIIVLNGIYNLNHELIISNSCTIRSQDNSTPFVIVSPNRNIFKIKQEVSLYLDNLIFTDGQHAIFPVDDTFVNLNKINRDIFINLNTRIEQSFHYFTMIELTSESNTVEVGEGILVHARLKNVITGTLIHDLDINFYEKDVLLGTVTIQGGVAEIEYRPTSRGAKKLSASFEGDDNYEQSVSNELSIIATGGDKINTDINVTIPNSIYVDDRILVNIIMDPISTTGEFELILDNEELVSGTLVNGCGEYVIPGTSHGEHSLVVNYLGDDDYNSSSETIDFNVSKFDSSMNLYSSIPVVVAKTPLNIVVSTDLDLTGDVVFKMDDEIIGFGSWDNYHANYSILNGLNSGEYVFIAEYEGDNKYNSCVSDELLVIVNKRNPRILLETQGNIITDRDTVYLNCNIRGATGNIKWNTYDEVINRVLVDSSDILTLSPLPIGEYTVKLVYEGDNNYFGGEKFITFNVVAYEKEDSNIVLSSNKLIIDRGEDSLILKANVTPASSGEVYFKEGDVVIGNGYLNNGEVSLEIDDLSVGEHTFVAVYTGDFDYNSNVSDELVITVVEDRLKTVFIGDDVLMYYKDGSRLEVFLIDNKRNPLTDTDVTFTINEFNYNRRTNSEGKAHLNLNLSPNIYTVTINYEGDENYKPTTTNKSVEILTTIFISKQETYYNGFIFADFLDIDGTPLTSTEVKLYIMGYVFTTTTDEKGTATFNLDDITPALIPREYIATIRNPVNNEVKTNNVMIKSSIRSENLILYHKSGASLEAVFYKKDGTYLKNRNVLFSVGTVDYVRKTNDVGLGKLRINLNPGEYEINITNPDTNETITKEVTVLKRIITEDLTMEYNDGSTFNARILDGNGSPSPNTKVMFQIGEVFLHSLTDDTGLAKYKVKLLPGEYLITTYYNDYHVTNHIYIVDHIGKNTTTTLSLSKSCVMVGETVSLSVLVKDEDDNVVVGAPVQLFNGATSMGSSYQGLTNSQGTVDFTFSNHVATDLSLKAVTNSSTSSNPHIIGSESISKTLQVKYDSTQFKYVWGEGNTFNLAEADQVYTFIPSPSPLHPNYAGGYWILELVDYTGSEVLISADVKMSSSDTICTDVGFGVCNEDNNIVGGFYCRSNRNIKRYTQDSIGYKHPLNHVISESTDTPFIYNDTWYHIEGSLNSTTFIFRIYHNNNPIYSKQTQISPRLINGKLGLLVGWDGGNIQFKNIQIS